MLCIPERHFYGEQPCVLKHRPYLSYLTQNADGMLLINGFSQNQMKLPSKFLQLQPIYCKWNPAPYETLLCLLAKFPKALDFNAFIGACENRSFACKSMILLFDHSSVEVYRSVRGNALRLAFAAVKSKNLRIVQLFIDRFPGILIAGKLLERACINGTADIVKAAIV